MVPLVYSPKYNITAFGLERLHPFDSRKYRRIHDWLLHQGLRKSRDFLRPRPISHNELLQIHTAEYLRSLGDRHVLAQILEVAPLRYLPACLTHLRVLRPMRWATGGTILAAQLALDHGLAINLGGGYHHAQANKGSGFCVYADVPLAVKTLHRNNRIASALIVDTDAHQGNGTADLIRPWSWARMLDLFQADIFPWPKVAEDLAIPLRQAPAVLIIKGPWRNNCPRPSTASIPISSFTMRAAMCSKPILWPGSH